MERKVLKGIALVLGLGFVLLVIAGWIVVMMKSDPLSSEGLSALPWPAACTTRGCITVRDWDRQQELVKKFSALTEQTEPHVDEALTTLIRQHLVNEAQAGADITTEEAERYRDNILQQEDNENLTKTFGMSLEEYDRRVIIPLLQQEALRQQTKVESLDELFVQLSGQRQVWVLVNDLWWDEARGKLARQK